MYHVIEPEENIYAICIISEKGYDIFACLCLDFFLVHAECFTFDM